MSSEQSKSLARAFTSRCGRSVPRDWIDAYSDSIVAIGNENVSLLGL